VQRQPPSARARLAEKLAALYVGLFVTLGGDCVAERSRAEPSSPPPPPPPPPQQATAQGMLSHERSWVEPSVVLGFAQRLVESRHSHFAWDPLFANADAAAERAVGTDDWCPSGLPEHTWADEVLDAAESDRTVLQTLHHLATQAVELLRQLPPDVCELMAGNYVEEAAWLVLSMARSPSSPRSEGAVRRLLHLMEECM
jgi:hypothetical protein